MPHADSAFTGTRTITTGKTKAPSATVSQKHPLYDLLLPDVVKNRDVVAGEREIKKKTIEYLPPLASMLIECDNDGGQTQSLTITREGQASYNKYLSLAYFYGATGRTVDGLTGLIYTKPAAVEIPDVLDYINSNADGKGSSLRKLSENASNEAFISPQSGLLTDYPSVNQSVSVADAEASNLRPKILHYKFESIINWFYEVSNNELKLSLVVLEELVTVRDKFDVANTVQYRVLELIEGIYHQSVYNGDEELILGPTLILVDGKPSEEIPFFFINVGAEKKSVINDLADANLNHYRFFADYAAKEHQSAFPVFWETGASRSRENISIGPGAKWDNPSTEAAFGVIQSASDGGSMRTYLLDMESRMAALGAEMLKPRISGVESAEAKSLDQVAQNSTVGSVSLNVSDALTKALKFAARWLGDETSEVFYKLNTDFGLAGLSGQDLTAMVGAWNSEAISYQTLFENLQKGEIANPTKSAEDELKQITLENLGV